MTPGNQLIILIGLVLLAAASLADGYRITKLETAVAQCVVKGDTK